MDEILREDRGSKDGDVKDGDVKDGDAKGGGARYRNSIFRASLYVLHGFDDPTTTYGEKVPLSEQDRINKFYGRPDLSGILDRELATRKGKLFVTGDRPIYTITQINR
jgi:hypothetical protein